MITVSTLQVALKRQQAAEDALALNMRSVASGENIQQLPEGPIIGLPGLPCGGGKHNESNAERRIKGEAEPSLVWWLITVVLSRGVRVLQDEDSQT